MQEPTRRRVLLIGSIAGMIMTILFGSMWIIAVLVNGDWTFGEDTLSELGGQVPSRWIFNSAVLVSGALGVVFSIALAIHFAPMRRGMAGAAMLAVASLGLMSVGIFPIDTGWYHSCATAFFFIAIACAAFSLVTPLRNGSGVRNLPFVSTMCAILVSFASLVLAPLPLAEAVTVICLLSWISALASWVIMDNDLLPLRGK